MTAPAGDPRMDQRFLVEALRRVVRADAWIVFPNARSRR
jgi:hypothetical protein